MEFENQGSEFNPDFAMEVNFYVAQFVRIHVEIARTRDGPEVNQMYAIAYIGIFAQISGFLRNTIKEENMHSSWENLFRTLELNNVYIRVIGGRGLVTEFTSIVQIHFECVKRGKKGKMVNYTDLFIHL